MQPPHDTISWADFEKVDIRVGTIISAELFAEARNASFKVTIDFGDLGIKKSSAQITTHYSPDTLINTQVLAVVNFPPKQIATMMSECLILGVINEDKSVILLRPDQQVTNGLKIG